jgi:hypothetical protein
MKKHLQLFWLLFLAYTVSLIYQYYRFTLTRIPEYDTFGIREIILAQSEDKCISTFEKL